MGQLKRMVRTWLAVVNERYGVVIGPRHWLFSWIVRHAAWVANRFVGKGTLKTTAYETIRGRKYGGPVVAFGECVMARLVSARKFQKSKNDVVWTKSVLVGKEEISYNWLVATRAGVTTCRTLRRLPDTESHLKELLLQVGGQPWALKKDGWRPALPAGGMPVLIPVPVGANAGEPVPAVHEPGLPMVKPEDEASSSSSSSSSSSGSGSARSPMRGTATPAADPMGRLLAAPDAMATETLGMKLDREATGNESDDEERIQLRQ